MAVISNSTFLDGWGFQQSSAAQVATLARTSATVAEKNAVFAALFGKDPVAASGTDSITVALTLNRANDPSAVMASNWATRTKALANEGSTFATYGATKSSYDAAVSAVRDVLGSSADAAFNVDSAYVANAASRTIWLKLDPAHFKTLFGTDLLKLDGNFAWRGELSLRDDIAANLRGIWVDQSLDVPKPNLTPTTGITLDVGPLGVGNTSAAKTPTFPGGLAKFYNYPLSSQATPDVALIEAPVTAVGHTKLLEAINAYRAEFGLSPYSPTQFQVNSNSGTNVVSGELTLDISVIAGAVPNSKQILYTTLGGTAYAAYQQAFFDTVRDPAVLSSSFAIFGQSSPNSPFQKAWQDLFVDGALSRVSVQVAAGDSGSSADFALGVPMTRQSLSPATALVVSGTSISTRASATTDTTLSNTSTTNPGLLQLALNNDPATLWNLMQAGLKALPSSLPTSPSADGVTKPALSLPGMFESVWNDFRVKLNDKTGAMEVNLGAHSSGTGGVDLAQPVPAYQQQFGLNPTSVGPASGSGRGTPDVAALSSGSASYSVLAADRVGDAGQAVLGSNGGTSAASPLWAALSAQLTAIFADQGLPKLGFYNDLLYEAAAVAPGAFNDIRLGNNITTFTKGPDKSGYFNTATGEYFTPTGLGYAADEGYDLASGLGTPNGLLLARALTQIAHGQMVPSAPKVLQSVGSLEGTSTTAQTLLVQSELNAPVLVQTAGMVSTVSASSSLAWNEALAQKALQADFDPNLIRLMDGAAQAAPFSIKAAAGQQLTLQANGSALPLYQINYTNQHGIAQFGNADGTIALARPVAVAETALGGNGQDAVVRMRQNGADSTSLTIFRVDDLNGTINGIAPGDSGYAAAVAGRAYNVQGGGVTIDSPGFGAFKQTAITGVNNGDLIAMSLTNTSKSQTFYAFDAANESVAGAKVGHLWSYGLNTWGWEDTFGGGDRDFNDLVVALDFTSAFGSGWIA